MYDALREIGGIDVAALDEEGMRAAVRKLGFARTRSRRWGGAS